MAKKSKPEIEKNRRIKIVIESFMLAIIWSIIIYLIVGPFNNTFVELLNCINTNNDALNITICILPILIIFILMIKLGKEVFSNSNVKNK